MSYPYFGINSELNLCYLFMQELQKCAKNKIYPKTNCRHEMEDFAECHNRRKHRESYIKAQQALTNAININVPHYDQKTDSFIYDDGKIVSNTDPMFKQYKWF